MRIRQPYTLFKRASKDHGEVWFVSYYGSDGLRHKESTGENNKSKAHSYAIGLLKRNAQQKSITLKEFAKPFFIWGECSWIKRQIAKGRGCNKQWAQAKRKMLEKHVLPKFGSLRLQQITRPAVESWLVDLPLSNQTRNHVLYALKTILTEAQDQGYLDRNPLEHAEPMGKQYRRRGFFTAEELQLLFPKDDNKLLKVWGNRKYATLFLTLAPTGLRVGEARALPWRTSEAMVGSWSSGP